MSDKEKVLKDCDAAYGELKEAIAGLDDTRARAVWLGTWGVKEILIHIAAWDREMAPALGQIGRGQAPYPAGTYDDFDSWNARFVEAGKDAPMHEILVDVETSHHGLMAAAKALGEEHFAGGAPAGELFEGTGAKHYREHADQIRDWRNGK